MGTFIAAYAVVWLVFVLYIIRLRTNQRRLAGLVQMLESRVQAMRVTTGNCSQADLGA